VPRPGQAAGVVAGHRRIASSVRANRSWTGDPSKFDRRRLSFTCSICDHTPASLRFLGRRVLASALRAGLSDCRVKQLTEWIMFPGVCWSAGTRGGCMSSSIPDSGRLPTASSCHLSTPLAGQGCTLRSSDRCWRRRPPEAICRLRCAPWPFAPGSIRSPACPHGLDGRPSLSKSWISSLPNPNLLNRPRGNASNRFSPKLNTALTAAIGRRRAHAPHRSSWS
jgi:hypothetical protein